MSAVPTVQRPPALTRAFDRLRHIRPADADAAEAVLLEVLRPVTDSAWPEIAWRYGVLTATGYPVELAWASRDTALRWTCEVAGPETPEADRLQLAQGAAANLLKSPLDLHPWTQAQQGHLLRWGAWLGLRQLNGTHRAKAYLELPSGEIAPGPWSAAAAELAARVGGLTWRMAGVNDDGSTELYARAPNLTWPELAAASSLLNLEDQLSGLVRELVGADRAGRVVVPRPSGVSLVLAASGVPVALTWFAIAKSIWGGDAAVQAAMLRMMGRVEPAPDSAELYRALSSGPDDGRWRHGMVGVGVDRDGGTWLQAGLRPT